MTARSHVNLQCVTINREPSLPRLYIIELLKSSIRYLLYYCFYYRLYVLSVDLRRGVGGFEYDMIMRYHTFLAFSQGTNWRASGPDSNALMGAWNPHKSIHI